MSSVLTNASIRLVSLLLFLSIWFGSSFFFNSSLLPGPIDVFEKIILEIESDELFFHTLITLKRVFLSFIIAMIIGTVLGIFMGRKEDFNTFFDDWLVLGLNIPALVIIILSYVCVPLK